PQTLRNNFSLQQIPDVRPDRAEGDLAIALALLVEDVHRVMKTTNWNRFNRRKQRRRDPDAVYLIDRALQEEQIGDAIKLVDYSGGVQAFFVAGPENECVDEFIDRLQRHTCAQYLGGGRSWHRLVIEWPAEIRGAEFSTTFLRRLAKE